MANRRTSWNDLDDAIQDEGGVVPCQNAPDLFFDFDEDSVLQQNRYTMARQLCADCPVKMLCLAYALDNNEEFGVWGGLSPHERSRLKAKTRRG